MKNGDHVVYSNRHPARVITSLPNGEVRIKFDDPNLIPPKMNVPASSLEWVLPDGSRKRFVNSEFRCPACDEPWKETKGFRFNYYDCPRCGAKKEDHT